MKSLIMAAIVLALTVSSAVAECRTDSECYMVGMGDAYNVESVVFNLDDDADSYLYITCENGATGVIDNPYEDIRSTQEYMKDICGEGKIDNFCGDNEADMSGWCGSPIQVMQYIEMGELNLDNYICGREYDVVIEELHQMYPGVVVTNEKLYSIEIEINDKITVIDCFKF